MFDLNILCIAVLNKILENIEDTHIVVVQCHDILRNIILGKHLFHPQKLSAATSYINILCFCSGQRNTILFLAKHGDQVIP